MSNGKTCTPKFLETRNPLFLEVKSWYSDPDTKFFRVDQDLKNYRRLNDKPFDWYPSAGERDEFMSFVANRRKLDKKFIRRQQRQADKKNEREPIEVYKDMLKLGYNRNQLESRINLIKSGFISQVNWLINSEAKKGNELELEQAIRRLGGYKKIVSRVFDKLSKATAESEYEYLTRIFGKPKSEEDEAEYRRKAKYRAEQMNKVAENKERFASLASRAIADAYGLVVDYKGVELSLRAYREEEDNNDSQKEDAGTQGERYIDIRTKKIMETLSPKVKSLLATIPMTDNSGRIMRDDLLQPRYLDPRQIAYVLPEIMRFSTSESMMTDLKDASDRYPFLTNLVNKLEGKYNKSDSDYQALVYTNFKRAANLYGYIDINKGSYRENKANTRSQNNSIFRMAGINMGGTVLDSDWCIYDSGGRIRNNVGEIASEVKNDLSSIKEKLGFVNTSAGGFDKRSAYKKNGEPTNYSDYTEYSRYAQENGGEAAMEKFLENNPDTVAKLVKAARGIGLDITDYQVRNAVLSPIGGTTAKILGETKTKLNRGTNRLESIVDNLISVYSEASRKDGDNLKYTVARDVANVVSNEFVKLNSALAVSFFDELEPRVLVEGSSLQTYIYPSLIHDTMDGLNNESRLDQDAYNEYLDNEYLQYEGYTLRGKPTGWLKKLRDGSAFNFSGKNGDTSGPYKLVHMTAFNHVEYINLSIPQKIAAQITMWANSHAVEAPIQADYTNAWDFVQNAGVESGIESEMLERLIEQRVNEEKARYVAENNAKMSFTEVVAMRNRIRDEVYGEYGSIVKPDGTYRTEWPVVQELSDEVLIEVDRISRLRKEIADDPKGNAGPTMDVFRKQGLKFQIFPELNDNGFYDKYNSFDSDVEAREFVENTVAEQLQKMIQRNFAYLERTKALTNPMLENVYVDKHKVNLHSPDGSIKNLSVSSYITLQNFFLDYFYGRLQMVKLMNGGMSNFKGLLDFEKRNMMNHATRRPVYTEATWNGKVVGRSHQNAIYLEDEVSDSAYFNDFGELLSGLEDIGYISKDQLKRYSDSYGENTSTDGQAFRTYESYRVTQIELGKWDEDREKVYNYLVYGRGMATKEEIANEMHRIYNPNEKPVYTGWEIVNGRKHPVLHKYSETVLFPVDVMKKLMGNDVPAQLAGLAMAADKLSEKSPFDIFLFHSCVKVGAHTVIDPLGFMTDENGKRIMEDGKPVRKCHTAEQISRFITDAVNEAPWTVHTLPMKYYGEAASTPAHGEDDEIAWSSQAVKMLQGNIESEEKGTVNGKEMDLTRARDLMDEIDAATVASKYKQVQELFDDPEELKDVLMSELATKSYSSPELEYAVSSGKVPYFYPSIKAGAEQLFSSIIKKRLTRPNTKGANLLQVTSLGSDVDPYGEGFGVSDEHKLKIVFEGSGNNKRIKWIECYMPIHDSRLEVFADENGNIIPEKLQELVDKKIVPEEALNFVAYRTPSDDIHSVLPLHVKGFTSKALGANIKIPKEVMKMTGHDFDGDKLRCHFQDFKIVWDEDAIYDKYLETAEDKNAIMQAILNQDDAAIKSFGEFKKEWAKNPAHYGAGNIQIYQYDYSKRADEQGQSERDNAYVQLAFGILTSPSGSRRMVIPGGSAETDVYGATFHIVRTLHDDPNLIKRVQESDEGKDIDFSNDVTIYDSLVKKTGKSLSKIMDIVNGNETPYSFQHSNEAFDYMIGGKKMISVFALYSSAGQMLQRLGLRVNQDMYKDKKTGAMVRRSIGFFGKEIDELYNIKNNADQLGSLTQSRFVNSAVDNGKNPRLGYLNQSPELAEMTNYLAAVNLSEEQIHLILNQPVVVEAVKRMRDQRISLGAALRHVRDEMVGDQAVLAEYKKLYRASKIILDMPRENYIAMMPMHFDDFANMHDNDVVGSQIALLAVLLNQNKFARRLSNFIKNTRPESESGGIKPTIAKTTVILDEFNKLREEILEGVKDETDPEDAEDVDASEECVDNKNLISGMAQVVRKVKIYDNDSVEEISKKISHSPLKRVTALEAMMQDKVMNLFSRYFPQAKEQWQNVITTLMSKYNASRNEKESIARSLADEMILWNLMKAHEFSGDIKADAKDLLINMPFRLNQLKERIAKEKERFEKGEPSQDEMARSLVDNIFLQKLSVEFSGDPNDKPRLSFRRGGVSMDNLAQKVSYDWAQMSVSPYEEIRKFATDLYKYNAFSSGFGFGMYEFAHFAPYTVLEETAGYLDALANIRDSYLFTDDNDDMENFVHQYYMNHWGDERLVEHYATTELPNVIRKQLGLSEQKGKAAANAEKNFSKIAGSYYIVVENKGKKDLYRVNYFKDDTVELEPAQKLGHRTRRNQVWIQYNPTIGFREIEAYQIGTDSNWELRGERILRNSESANIEDRTTDMDDSSRAAWEDAVANSPEKMPVTHYGKRLDAAVKTNERLFKKAADDVAKNDTTSMPSIEGSFEAMLNAYSAQNALKSVGQPAESQEKDRAESLFRSYIAEEGENGGGEKMAYISKIVVDENGEEKVVTRTERWTADAAKQARDQKVYVLLNQKLREILRQKGIGIGALTGTEARLRMQGIADFDAIKVTAEGLREMIRLAEGFRGEEALPEEFAHMALEMLGHDQVLVRRLLDALRTNDNALREAFEGQYEQYSKLYDDDIDKLVLEAAGKLVAKNLLREQEIQTPEVKSLLRRIVDAIKQMLKNIGSWLIGDAIMDANQISSQLARDILAGRLLDDMNLKNVGSTERFAMVQKDLTGKQGIMQRILQQETKRLAMLKKRIDPMKSKDQKAAVVVSTEKQIAMLEKAIRDHKVESALYDYMKNSLQFLKDTEASLDKLVNSGAKMNSVCRKLNVVRDTLYSYANVMKLIDDATNTGEIIKSQQLSDAIKETKKEIDDFFAKYEDLGMHYFERMLANVYGEHGVTRTLGKHKGEVLTIEEMARHGERDISLIGRMLSSIADCGDYVLAAFDDITRRAKISGRRRADEAHRRVVTAWEKYTKATGSKDQDFMFEYTVGDDGKRHRTGKYISKEIAENRLNAAQLEFYNEMMAIKQDIDKCLPPTLIKSPYQIVALRKFGVDRIKGAEGIRGKLDAFGENVKNAILDTSDEADKETRRVEVDFQKNKIDNLPVKYVTKGQSESWDDMTEDVAMSIVAYASMGYEYDELNQVIGMLENARYMSMNREIDQSAGIQGLVERVITGKTEDDYYYEQAFTKKQMYTNLQKALDDFFQMHLYGKLQKEEGGLFGTKISKRKVANILNAGASYTQMAFNLQQRISNVGAGIMNIGIETAGKGAFNAKDFAYGTKEYIKAMGDRIMDTGKLESDNKLSLFAERYDLHQNNGRMKDSSFKRSRFSKVFNTNLLFVGLNAGEDYLALTTALAIAHNHKVKGPDGKIGSFYDVFEVKYSDPANKTGAHLEIKSGYTMADGSAITREVEEKYAKLVIGTNFRLQGIYNSDDKSAIQQYAFGSLVMMYRKWMHPALIRRYGKEGFNPLTGTEGEGYWRTFAKWIGESFKDVKSEQEGADRAYGMIEYVKALWDSFALNKSEMTDYERSNLNRAAVEGLTLLGVCLAIMLHSKFGPDKDQKEVDEAFSGWFTNMAVYQMFRLRNEIGSVAPSPLMLREGLNILQSPVAAIEPARKFLRIFELLWPGTWTKEIKSGTFKGKSRANKIIFELPILSLYKQIDHVIDPTPLINYYQNDHI